MKLKAKIAKKALSLVISIVMIFAAIGFNLSFSTFATEQQEIDFCIDRMKTLPTNDEFLKKMRELPTEKNLNRSRHEDIVHSDGSTDPVDFDEKEVYEEIKRTVDDLIGGGTGIKESAQIMLNFVNEQDKSNGLMEIQDSQGSNDLSADMKKADAIYLWVAKNIHYDFESADCDKTLAERKPQDAYFVFKKETGVCEGYANLLNLMMRMAGISCINVKSIRESKESNCQHAFNAIYVENEGNGQKGWTLLDSCWASPSGPDGDAEIRKHLEGEIIFNNFKIENILATENEYTKEFMDELNKISSENQKSSAQEFINDLNKKLPEVLPKLKEKYIDSPHFEKFEFFAVWSRGLFCRYKTDLTMEQAKQGEDSLRKDKIYHIVDSATDALTGKLKLKWGDPSSLNQPLSILGNSNIYLEKDRPLLPHLRVVNNDFNYTNHELEKYYDELQTTYLDATSISFDKTNLEEGIKKINEELNQKLEKINQNYSDITTIKRINLSLEEDDNKIWIFAALDIDFTEQDIENLKEILLEEEKPEEAKSNRPKFEEFFPAFYSDDNSIDNANRSIVSHKLHKISKFDLFLSKPSEDSDMSLNIKLNMAMLNPRSCEGNAEIHFYDLFFEDSSAGIAYIDKLLGYGLPIERRLSKSFYEKLVLKGDCSITGYENIDIKEIDAEKSSRYSLEDGILYEKTDSGEKNPILEFYDGAYRTFERNFDRKIMKN